MAKENEAPTADANAGTDDVAAAIKDAQATQQAQADAVEDARANDLVTPDATYVAGQPGANVNFAIPADAPVVSTYEDALEAGYFGVAAGHANTEKMSVSAVTERDRRLGLTRSPLKGAVVNGPADDPNTAKKDDSK